LKYDLLIIHLLTLVIPKIWGLSSRK